MAVLEDVPGLKVVVIVAGNEATEYDDPNDVEREPSACPTSSKYIECTDDAEFSIKAYITRDYAWGYRNHALSARLKVDGQHIRSTFHTERDKNYILFSGRELYCATTKQWYLHRCKFSAISTIDDAEEQRIKSDIKIAKNLGVIEVKFRRCIPLHKNEPRDKQRGINSSDKLELAEKSLKGRAMSHGTSFSSRREKVEVHSTYNLEYIDEIALFRFHYRSRDALRKEMVIPRSPSPSSTPLAEMPRAELERLARERLDQLQENKVKKEDRNPVIKREFNTIVDLDDEHARPAKMARHVEVIDLTDA
ncbi:hypothetical protein GGR53DRAFT_465769 [Hypoxylon sp. FL1150]|nr:hypothetical protein GGR53DRAFT_465769 [Hypoxylon sp. FL1150]